MNAIRALCILAALCAVTGCASRSRGTSPVQPPTSDARAAAAAAATTQPILYHRTGGIAGTDDRVVIWPDGFVQVIGRVLTPATARLPGERLERLAGMFDGWDQLNDSYRDANIVDAHAITISYGGKTVSADDIAPGLPEAFRRIFTEIEFIAAAAASEPPARPASPPAAAAP